MKKISVVICTHNPRTDYLRRVLDALMVQTLPKEQWELLLIDNATIEPLASRWDLSWHPHAHHIREDELGLTPARMRGIRESVGELLVFVDDDNVLAADFLEQSLAIRRKRPFVGAFSGTCEPEFEQPIEPWQHCYLGFLAIRKITKPVWANFPDAGCSPYGAGLVVTRNVAETYLDLVKSDPLRRSLDRKGANLSSGGDCDLAATAYDLSLATGLFPELVLTHLIPAQRLKLDYLIKLKREGGASGYILEFIRKGKIPPAPEKIWVTAGRFLLWLRMSSIQRKMLAADQQARQLAIDLITHSRH